MARALTAPRITAAWRESWTRAAVLSVVALFHLGLLVLMHVVPWPHAPIVTAVAESTAIEIRLIAPRARPAASSPARAQPVVVSRHVPAMPVRPPVPPPEKSAPPKPRPPRLLPVLAAADAAAGTDPFDAGLRAAQVHRPVAQLPGSSKPIVAGLHMVDPRSQGASGAVRRLAGLLGATDPHCVAVDAWRSLTIQEMLDRHISPGEVDRVAEEYRCKPR